MRFYSDALVALEQPKWGVRPNGERYAFIRCVEDSSSGRKAASRRFDVWYLGIRAELVPADLGRGARFICTGDAFGNEDAEGNSRIALSADSFVPITEV